MIYLILIIIGIFLLYAVIENAFMLCVRREKFGGDIKVVHISDLHKKRFGKYNKRLCRIVERESPDVIIISGDLVSRSETNFETVGKTLEKLCRIAPVYMIFGNHEQSMLPEMQKKFLETVSLTDARLLRNENDVFEKNGRRITIYGLEEHYEVYKKNGGYRDLEIITPEDMQTYLGDIADEEVWLIAHNPFFAESYSQWGADVVFSGHVHGGSVRLFGRAILSPERVFFPKNSKGVYEFGRTKLLVSAGLGKLRLFNPPEVVVYVI
ncbi:MAG: metallophosphoesterase [Ruminococcus sp.]|nr:metallophosphoesterase [Ruminococcus sp.]